MQPCLYTIKKGKIFILLFFLLISGIIGAQNQQVKIPSGRLNIQKVFQVIEKQTNLSVDYNQTRLNVLQRINIQSRNNTLSGILDEVLKNTGFEYTIEKGHIIIRQSLENNKIQQSNKKREISGTVVDKAGEPVIGANIIERGTTNGTTTDTEGKFILSVSDGASLTVSYIGYNAEEIPIKGRNVLNVVLQEDTQALDEVVVVGYGTMEKRAVTSSITSIKGKDLPQGVGGSSIATALQGKISGLTISSNSSPNASNSFQLRGVTSINASQGPLVVVDGIPGGDIRAINQEDIESIDVLRDASAAAIYGTRAAGGVLLITTKQAEQGSLRLTYTGEFTTEAVRRKPEVLSASEFVEHGLGTDYGSDTDWFDKMTQSSPFSHRHVVNISGGNKSVRAYTTFTYQDQKGIALGDNRRDYSGRINLNFNLLKELLEIRTRAEYRNTDRDMRNSNYNMALKLNPTLSPYDETNPTGYNVWTGLWEFYNPLADTELKQNDGKDKWLLADATFKFRITPDLSVQATAGYQKQTYRQVSYTSAFHMESIENSNRRGNAYQGYSEQAQVSLEAYANYNKVFGDHNLAAVAGYSFWENNSESFSMQNYDFPVDGVGPWNMGSGTWLSDGRASMSSYKAPRERLLAVFGRLNYAYKDKYLFSASLRHEGSSKFGRNNKWGNFWAVSGGWRLSEETFLKDISFINDFKVRLSYGVTGNNGFSAGQSTKMYQSDAWWLMNGIWNVSYGSTHNVNEDLCWEEKSELNFGFDYSFLDNRLFGKFDLYKRKVDGLIYSVSVPVPPNVHDQTTMNMGDLENRGWELEIGGEPVRTRDFSYRTTMRFSHNTSKIKSLWDNSTYQDRKSMPDPGSPGTAVRLQAGSTIGDYFLWRYAGVDENGEWLVYDKNNKVIPEKEKTVDDKSYVGNAIPKLILAWENTFTYKNWDMTILIRSWLGYDVFNTLNMYYGTKTLGGSNVLKTAFTDNQHVKSTQLLLSDYWLENGSFLKIDAINIGYNLSLRKYNKYIDNIRLYGTIRDVAVFTKYSGLNPEVDINGLEPGFEMFNSIYPQTRRYTLGIQLNF